MYLNKFMCQLECRGFKSKVLSWRDRKNEAKVYVYDVTLSIKQNVAIVSILHLHYVTNKTVASTAPDKIPLSLQKVFCGFSSKFLDEILTEWELTVLFYLMEWDSIDDGLNHTTILGSNQDVVRPDPQWNMFLFPDIL